MKFEIIHLTGASGFIGSKLNQRLTKEGVKVFSYDFKNISKVNLEPKRIKDMLQENLDKQQIILHFGAVASTSDLEIEEVREKNVEYTFWLSKIAANLDIPFVFASSAATYGRDMQATRDVNPLNYYGSSKARGEEFLISQYRNHLSNLIVCRLFNVYGFDERGKGSMMSIPSRFILDCLTTKEIDIWKLEEGLNQSRDFIHVEDVVEIIIQIIQRHPWSETLVDLGTGESVAFIKIASLLSKLNEATVNFIKFPNSFDSSTYQVFTKADLSNLNRLGILHKSNSIESNLDELLSQYRRSFI